MKKLFYYLLLASLLAIFQASFVSVLPWHLWRLDSLILALVFTLGLFGHRPALYLAIAVGFFTDFYSFLPFGANLLFWPLIIQVAYLLQSEWLTDKSLYSFVLLTAFVFLTRFLYHRSLDWFVSGGSFSLGWVEPLSGLLVNISATALVFYLVQPMAANLQPFLLSKRQ